MSAPNPSLCLLTNSSAGVLSKTTTQCGNSWTTEKDHLARREVRSTRKEYGQLNRPFDQPPFTGEMCIDLPHVIRCTGRQSPEGRILIGIRAGPY